MVSIEQVRLLESRVIKTIEFVDQVTEENILLKSKLESCQKRIDELEVLIQRFKEDQAKIEDGIISALDRLNKFEDDMDKGISKAKAEAHPSAKTSAPARAPAHEAEPEPEAPSETATAIEEEGFVLKEKPYNPQDEDESKEAKTPSELEIF